MPDVVKIVVYVPESHADAVRTAMGAAGAGRIGHYSYCSFSSKGTGRFLPGEGAHPAIGAIGAITEVPEERIEADCALSLLEQVIAAIKCVHPYEDVALDVYPLLDAPP